MRKPKHIALEFPILGIDTNKAKRSQPDKSSIDCQNVRGYGYEERARGGQRPGMSQFSLAMNGSERIQALTSIITVPAGAAAITRMNLRTLTVAVVCKGQIRTTIVTGSPGAYAPSTPSQNSNYSNDLNPSATYVGVANHFRKVYFSDGYMARYYDVSDDTSYDWVSSVTAPTTAPFPVSVTTNQVNVTLAIRTDTTVTITTAGHTMVIGESVLVDSVHANYNGTYIITSVTGTTITYEQAGLETDNPGAVTGTITGVRYPRLLATWRGRIVASGLTGADAHNWFMSAKDDPLDWDYSPVTIVETQAVAGNSSNAGQIGEVITALIPVSDDVLIFGCDSSIWQLTGDPMVGGRFDLISDITGMAFGSPWCKDPNGTLYFFGNRGHVYSMTTGGGRTVKNLTAMRMPKEFEAINLSENRIELVWDDDEQGVNVIVIPLAADTDSISYFYSARLDAWFKDRFALSRNPTVTHVIDGDDPDDRQTLLGQEDGIIRSFKKTATSDDGQSIDSYVFIGPIQVETGTVPFIISELQATIAKDSSDVSYKLYVGNSAEDAINLSGYLLNQNSGRMILEETGGFIALQGTTGESHVDVFGGDFKATRSIVHHPRKRGHAAYVKLYNNNDAETWAMESLRVKLMIIDSSLRRQRT